jgi:hypothetical protein
MSLSHFGGRVMQWGTGHEAALSRRRRVTPQWLTQNGVTLEMLRQWHRFYLDVDAANPENPSARGRAALMSHCIELLEERGMTADGD